MRAGNSRVCGTFCDGSKDPKTFSVNFKARCAMNVNRDITMVNSQYPPIFCFALFLHTYIYIPEKHPGGLVLLCPCVRIFNSFSRNSILHNFQNTFKKDGAFLVKSNASGKLIFLIFFNQTMIYRLGGSANNFR